MTEERLQELERLANEATEGPWKYGDDAGDCYHTRYEIYDGEMFLICPEIVSKNDAAFIAAAREAVPALITEVRRLGKLAGEYFAQAEQAEAEADWLAEQCQTLSGYSPILRQGLSKKQWLEAAHKDVNQEGL